MKIVQHRRWAILAFMASLLGWAFTGLIVKLFGRVTMLCFLGESLARAFHRRGVSVLGGSMLGLLFFGFLTFLHLWGGAAIGA